MAASRRCSPTADPGSPSADMPSSPGVECEQFVELPFLVGVPMNPSRQQEPVLSPNQLPGRATFAKGFRSPYLGNRFIRTLHHVELVVHQATPGSPLLQARPKLSCISTQAA